MLARDVHARVVRETLGQSQINLTMDTYSHVMPALGADAAPRKNDLIGFKRGVSSA